MTLLTNPVAVPFFERVPRRLMPALRRAYDRSDISRDTVSDQYKLFLADIAGEGVPGPTFDEFREWFAGAKLSRDPHADLKPYEPVAKGAIERLFGAQPSTSNAELQAEAYLRKVHAIIVAAVRLYQAKVDAGYSPESSETDDQIVADSIGEWLTAEAVGWSQAMSLEYTPGEVAMRLLSNGDSDQNAKLLDVFAIHMQRELSLAIVEGRAKGGAA